MMMCLDFYIWPLGVGQSYRVYKKKVITNFSMPLCVNYFVHECIFFIIIKIMFLGSRES